jgi:hypothetical protein
MFHKLLSNILKVSESPFGRREITKDFRLILNHLTEEIVRMKMRRSIPSGQYSKGGMSEVNFDEASIHGVMLGDLEGICLDSLFSIWSRQKSRC